MLRYLISTPDGVRERFAIATIAENWPFPIAGTFYALTNHRNGGKGKALSVGRDVG
jgi:hypothetical protein